MHWLQVPFRAVAWTAAAVTVVTWLAWAWRNRRARKARQARPDGQDAVRDLFWPTEAALVAAVWGGWVTAAVAFGPTARPDRWPTLVYLAGAAGGYWWLRRHEAVQAARKRRDDGGRRPGRQEAVARDPAPGRAGRLACAMAAHHEPR